jgi:RES domain-containing protein
VPNLRAWRLSKQRYAAAAFTGEGARLFGGRWNPVGVSVVYASLSLSLAVLEVFVHMTAQAEPSDFVSVMVDLGIEEDQAERVDKSKLPRDWARIESPATQEIGREWAHSMRSLALLVPSVIVDDEWNVLINPLHPDAARVKIAQPKPFHFDQRMFGHEL